MDKNGGSRRKGERTMAQAVLLAIAATIGAAIVCYVYFYFKPPSDLHNFYEVSTAQNSGISPTSELMQKFRLSIANSDVPTTLFCMIVGGLVLGKTAPRTARRRRIFLTAFVTGVLVGICSQAMAWGGVYIVAQKTGQSVPRMDSLLLIVQTSLIIVWALGCGLGGFIGADWRNRSAGASPKPAATQ